MMKKLFTKTSVSLLLSVALCTIIALSCGKKNKGTCVDGIKNQNETAVDCGGECPKCVTCSDGIQNQSETGIDCGGPCSACPINYPEFGSYGRNLLYIDTMTYIKDTVYYNVKCILKDGEKVKVSFPDVGGSASFSEQMTGWTMSWSGSTPTFTAVGPSTADMGVSFTGQGSVNIHIYENNSPTAIVKKYIWH